MVMVPNNYHIDLSELFGKGDFKRYRHIARVELGQLLPEHAADYFDLFRTKFTLSENFHLVLVEVSCSGTTKLSTDRGRAAQ